MKALLTKVQVSADASFAVRRLQSASFGAHLHFHSEFELVLITQGTGKRLVGDTAVDFGPGNLVLLGPNLPHWYRTGNDPGGLEAQSIVVQFAREFLGKAFLEAPEMARIRQVLESAAGGLEIRGGTRERIAGLMADMPDLTGMKRLLRLLSILHLVADSEECIPLSTPGKAVMPDNDRERINQVYGLVMSRFTEAITLKEVSDHVSMCPSAFCRYFRKKTGKTFSCFLSEVRIAHACKLLIESDRSVTEVCFLSGFNNLSYFNRQFKALKKATPRAFKQAYR